MERHPPFHSTSVVTPTEEVHQLHPIPCNGTNTSFDSQLNWKWKNASQIICYSHCIYFIHWICEIVEFLFIARQLQLEQQLSMIAIFIFFINKTQLTPLFPFVHNWIERHLMCFQINCCSNWGKSISYCLFYVMKPMLHLNHNWIEVIKCHSVQMFLHSHPIPCIEYMWDCFYLLDVNQIHFISLCWIRQLSMISIFIFFILKN